MPTIVFADAAAVATAAKSDLGWRKVEASGRITSADRKKGDEMDLRQNAATQRRRSLASASISNSLRLFPLPLKRRQSYAIKSEECLLSPPPPLPFRPTLSMQPASGPGSMQHPQERSLPSLMPLMEKAAFYGRRYNV